MSILYIAKICFYDECYQYHFLKPMLKVLTLHCCLTCILCNEVTIKQKSVGKSQILSSRRLLTNLKYYQADDVTSHRRLSYLERLTMLRNTMLVIVEVFTFRIAYEMSL